MHRGLLRLDRNLVATPTSVHVEAHVLETNMHVRTREGHTRALAVLWNLKQRSVESCSPMAPSCEYRVNGAGRSRAHASALTYSMWIDIHENCRVPFITFKRATHLARARCVFSLRRGPGLDRPELRSRAKPPSLSLYVHAHALQFCNARRIRVLYVRSSLRSASPDRQVSWLGSDFGSGSSK